MEYIVVNPMIESQMSEAFAALLPEGYLAGGAGEYFIGVANEDYDAVGILGFLEEPDRYKITYLYVEEAYRRQGVATLLIDTLIGFIESNDLYKDIEANFSELYSGIYEFFEDSAMFDIYEYSETHHFSYDEIVGNEMIQKLIEKDFDRVTGLFDLPNGRRMTAIKYLAENTGYIVDDYTYWQKNCAQDLCMCIVNDENMMEAAAIVERVNENTLSLSYLFASKPIQAMKIIGAVCQKYANDYRGFEVIIEPVSESGTKVMTSFLGDTGTKVNNYEAVWNYLEV